KTAVQRAIQVVTHQGKVDITKLVRRRPHGYDLAILLDGYRICVVIGREGDNLCNHLAAVAEMAVQRAIRVVTREQKVQMRGIIKRSSNDDLTILLDGDPISLVTTSSDIKGDHTIAAKGGVQTTPMPVSHQHNVSGPTPCDND